MGSGVGLGLGLGFETALAWKRACASLNFLQRLSL